METTLSREEVLEGQKNFIQFISNDFNKQMLINTVENCIKGSDWPMSYYNLRSEYLPGLMGEDASKYFFWIAFGGYYFEEIEFDEKEIALINYISFNYTKIFIRAKKYNYNPLGFDGINFTHGPENDRFNYYIKRNDEYQFMLRTNPLEFLEMITESVDYYTEMMVAGVIDYEDKKDEILNNIETINNFLNRLSNRISNVGTNNAGI